MNDIAFVPVLTAGIFIVVMLSTAGIFPPTFLFCLSRTIAVNVVAIAVMVLDLLVLSADRTRHYIRCGYKGGAVACSSGNGCAWY